MKDTGVLFKTSNVHILWTGQIPASRHFMMPTSYSKDGRSRMSNMVPSSWVTFNKVGDDDNGITLVNQDNK